MQSTDIEEIKAALLQGQNRWYPVENVTIERPRVCPIGACDLEEATG